MCIRVCLGIVQVFLQMPKHKHYGSANSIVAFLSAFRLSPIFKLKILLSDTQ